MLLANYFWTVAVMSGLCWISVLLICLCVLLDSTIVSAYLPLIPTSSQFSLILMVLPFWKVPKQDHCTFFTAWTQNHIRINLLGSLRHCLCLNLFQREVCNTRQSGGTYVTLGPVLREFLKTGSVELALILEALNYLKP